MVSLFLRKRSKMRGRFFAPENVDRVALVASTVCLHFSFRLWFRHPVAGRRH